MLQTRKWTILKSVYISYYKVRAVTERIFGNRISPEINTKNLQNLVRTTIPLPTFQSRFGSF